MKFLAGIFLLIGVGFGDPLLYKAVVKLIEKYRELESRVMELERELLKLKEQRETQKIEKESIDLRTYGIVKTWLKFRAKPSLDSHVFFVLRPNEKVEILENLGKWYKVRTLDGYVGYVYSEYVMVVQE